MTIKHGTCAKDSVRKIQPCQVGARGVGWTSGVTWVSWAVVQGNRVGCEGRLCRASAPAGPLENTSLGPGCAISTLQEYSCCPVSVLLCPQLPRGVSWSDQTLTFQGVDHKGCWPTDRNSDYCLDKQDSRHFRSKIFKLFCVKYVVSQDWEFILSFVYYVLQKR